MFLPSCYPGAKRGDGSRHSLNTSGQHRECDEDLIFDFYKLRSTVGREDGEAVSVHGLAGPWNACHYHKLSPTSKTGCQCKHKQHGTNSGPLQVRYGRVSQGHTQGGRWVRTPPHPAVIFDIYLQSEEQRKQDI